MGLFLILTALFITGANLLIGDSAGRKAAESAEKLLQLLNGAEKLPTGDMSQADGMQYKENTADTDDTLHTDDTMYTEQKVPEYILHQEIEMPVIMLDDTAYVGILEIPELSLTLAVIDQWSYKNLRLAPCRYSGSAYEDNLIVCAHNYNTHFGQLENLRAGDAIYFTDMDGNGFTYVVDSIEVIDGEDAEQLTDGDWALTLFTCTVSGRERILVRCQKY